MLIYELNIIPLNKLSKKKLNKKKRNKRRKNMFAYLKTRNGANIENVNVKKSDSEMNLLSYKDALNLGQRTYC